MFVIHCYKKVPFEFGEDCIAWLYYLVDILTIGSLPVHEYEKSEFCALFNFFRQYFIIYSTEVFCLIRFIPRDFIFFFFFGAIVKGIFLLFICLFMYLFIYLVGFAMPMACTSSWARGLILHHGSNPNYSSDNARFLTCCPTGELFFFIFEGW